MKSLKSKKAQVEIQFRWIFVIIVGAIILAFLLSFVFSQSKSNEQQISATIAKHFETIISTTNQKIGTVKTYKIPLTKINFDCDTDQGLYQYSIGGVKAKDTKYQLIFSSKELTGDRIFTWTENWNVPYQVGTFLYITNNREQFAFVTSKNGPTNNEKKLINNFAPNLSISIINHSDMGFSNYPTSNMNANKYTYIIINSTNQFPAPNEFIKIPHSKAKIIIINPADPRKLFDYGTILILNYHQYDSLQLGKTEMILNPTKTSYLGKASLYAAIFAGDVNKYECGMNKALQRLKLVSKIQVLKIEDEKIRLSPTCQQYLIGSDVANALRGAEYFLNETIQTIDDSNQDFSKKLLNIHELIKKIIIKNQRAMIETNCPLIY